MSASAGNTQQTQAVRLGWDSLFLSGSIVSLKTSMWRARSKLKASDLGIEDTADVKSALSLGCHRLAPSGAFEDIWSPARKAVGAIDFFSTRFGLITGARYVPDKNLQPLLAQLGDYKEDFDTAVAAFMENYEHMKAQHLPIIQAALVSAAKTPEAAQRAYDRVLAEFPSVDEVRASFALSWSIYAVRSPKTESAQRFAEQEVAEVKSILGETIRQNRGDFVEVLSNMISIVAKGGKLNQRSINHAEEMLNRLEGLNFLGDSALSRQIQAMRSALASVDKAKVDSGFVTGLTQIQTELQQSVDDAIAEAERNLTGVGRRRLELAPEPAAAPVVDAYADL